METAESIEVEVAYALPTRQRVLKIRVPSGATVGAAVHQSGILAMFPQIDLAHAKLGIFSRRVGLGHVLRAGDRIEIYRPLLADPKAARRARAGVVPAKGQKIQEASAAKDVKDADEVNERSVSATSVSGGRL